jgi:hypothetical protein
VEKNFTELLFYSIRSFVNSNPQLPNKPEICLVKDFDGLFTAVDEKQPLKIVKDAHVKSCGITTGF